jgi:DNA helicase IV
VFFPILDVNLSLLMCPTARLLKTLNAVQTKLQHLEQENGISRRRVRELEMELEVCKRDVARERTRVLEREETIVQQRRDANYIAASKKQKGKARAQNVSMDGEIHERLKEAVEEKKGLFFGKST